MHGSRWPQVLLLDVGWKLHAYRDHPANMFTPHQSVHHFSPSRRNVLGGKRPEGRKAHLGSDEAASIGTYRVFSLFLLT